MEADAWGHRLTGEDPDADEMGWDGSMRPRVIAGIATPRVLCREEEEEPCSLHALLHSWQPLPWPVDLWPWPQPSRLLNPAMPCRPIVCASPFHHVSAHVACHRQRVTGATSKEKPARFFQLAQNQKIK